MQKNVSLKSSKQYTSYPKQVMQVRAVCFVTSAVSQYEYVLQFSVCPQLGLRLIWAGASTP